ncbi:MAG TPA: hypothetical protein VFN30_15465 [Chitinophagaceae bacterium]|nr:hypothetical protein [Chitinophagaceae bacterium]
MIKKLLASNKPIMIARIGESELEVIRNYLAIQSCLRGRLYCWWHYILHAELPKWSGRQTLVIDSGFFPETDEMLSLFSRNFIEDLKYIDGLGIWYNKSEDYVARRYFPKAALFPLESIEPYFFKEPWTALLEGKKVLVVHPFAESIAHNYLKHRKLFNNPKVLPTFQLNVIKAVQTIAKTPSEFKTWFDALNAMCDKIKESDFDIAIIGAGAYGLPLAAFVKRLGKKAIHMGGATQILFGIKGVRWDNSPLFQSLYNEYWTRPLEAETPKNYKAIGEGNYSYW